MPIDPGNLPDPPDSPNQTGTANRRLTAIGVLLWMIVIGPLVGRITVRAGACVCPEVSSAVAALVLWRDVFTPSVPVISDNEPAVFEPCVYDHIQSLTVGRILRFPAHFVYEPVVCGRE